MQRLISCISLILIMGCVWGQEPANIYEKVKQDLFQADYKKADAIIDELLEKNPNDVKAFDLRTHYHILRNELSAAREHLEQGLSSFSRNPFYYDSRAYYYYTVMKFDHSIRDLDRAIELIEDDSIRNVFLISRAVSKSGKMDHEGAYADYMIVYNYDSTNIHVLNNLGAMADNLGKQDDAIKYLLRVIYLQPDFAPAYVNMGYQLQKMEKHEDALDYFDQAVELDPKDAFAYSNRSYSRLYSGDVKGAMKDIEKSLKLYPENSYAYRNRAHIYLKMGEKEKACTDLYQAERYNFSKMYGPEVIKLISMNCF